MMSLSSASFRGVASSLSHAAPASPLAAPSLASPAISIAPAARRAHHAPRATHARASALSTRDFVVAPSVTRRETVATNDRGEGRGDVRGAVATRARAAGRSHPTTLARIVAARRSTSTRGANDGASSRARWCLR
jgi:hypothetical protein